MRVKQGVAATKPVRPNAARAANFLLNIRQNVEDMLLENEEHDGHAEVFTFRVLAESQFFLPFLSVTKLVQLTLTLPWV